MLTDIVDFLEPNAGLVGFRDFSELDDAPVVTLLAGDAAIVLSLFLGSGAAAEGGARVVVTGRVARVVPAVEVADGRTLLVADLSGVAGVRVERGFCAEAAALDDPPSVLRLEEAKGAVFSAVALAADGANETLFAVPATEGRLFSKVFLLSSTELMEAFEVCSELVAGRRAVPVEVPPKGLAGGLLRLAPGAVLEATGFVAEPGVVVVRRFAVVKGRLGAAVVDFLGEVLSVPFSATSAAGVSWPLSEGTSSSMESTTGTSTGLATSVDAILIATLQDQCCIFRMRPLFGQWEQSECQSAEMRWLKDLQGSRCAVDLLLACWRAVYEGGRRIADWAGTSFQGCNSFCANARKVRSMGGDCVDQWRISISADLAQRSLRASFQYWGD